MVAVGMKALGVMLGDSEDATEQTKAIGTRDKNCILRILGIVKIVVVCCPSSRIKSGWRAVVKVCKIAERSF
jgi:hypothetical protein